MEAIQQNLRQLNNVIIKKKIITEILNNNSTTSDNLDYIIIAIPVK